MSTIEHTQISAVRKGGQVISSWYNWAKFMSTTDAREYGKHLAEMLAASHFSLEEKQAWAALVPVMTAAQLVQFDTLLRADMQAEASHELEDLLIAVKAAQHKRDLSVTAANEQAHQELDAIQKELEAAGK